MLVAAMVIAITTVIARNGLMGIAMGIAATPTGGESGTAVVRRFGKGACLNARTAVTG